MPTESQSRATEFRCLLGSRVFVSDGAMGTMLYGRGVFINRSFDELNLSAPATIEEIHRAYLAGTPPEVLGTRYRLGRCRIMQIISGPLRAQR